MVVAHMVVRGWADRPVWVAIGGVILAAGANLGACTVSGPKPAADLEEGAATGSDADPLAAAAGTGGSPTTAGGVTTSGSGGAGGGEPEPTVEPGGACACDADCLPVEGYAGICVYGICMNEPSDACSGSGSQAECPSGSRCWGYSGEAGSVCWPDCASYSCDGECDEDDSCAPPKGSDCDYNCGSYCSCQPGDCPGEATCIEGKCIEAIGPGPGVGPGPSCPNLPDRDCSSNCGDLVVFNPRVTPWYDDYAINGETNGNQYRSYLRRDLKMLVDYATAKTLCKSDGWTGNGGPLGLGDMSEANGAIPGTSDNDPGHPYGSHTNGFDIDLGYYQINTPDNRLRPICDYANNHCVAPPHLLDTWRTAMFLGSLLESPRVRIIGVDGQAGAVLDAAMSQLCNDDWLDATACTKLYKVAYEVTNQGNGWFYHHHHHAHISMCPGNAPCNNVTSGGAVPPLAPGLGGQAVKANPHRFAFGAL